MIPGRTGAVHTVTMRTIALPLVRALLPGAGLLLALAAAGCSSIGVHHRAAREALDFGEPAELSFCVLLDEGVSRELAEELLLAWNEHEAAHYGLSVRIASFARHERGGFLTSTIARKLWAIPLPDTCDRVLFFAGYDVRDTLSWPFKLWEIRGRVNSTGTHGFIMSGLAHPEHLLRELLHGRRRTTIHELYHMLGCEHTYGRMQRCYERIRGLKHLHRVAREPAAVPGQSPFFPTYRSGSEQVLTTRRAVRAAMGTRAPAPLTPGR